MEHEWLGLGSAPFTPTQAFAWAQTQGEELADDWLEVRLERVVCRICDEDYLMAQGECRPPLPLPGHRWVAVVTQRMTGEEVPRWADPASGPAFHRAPGVVSVTCAICGITPEVARTVRAAGGDEDGWSWCDGRFHLRDDDLPPY